MLWASEGRSEATRARAHGLHRRRHDCRGRRSQRGRLLRRAAAVPRSSSPSRCRRSPASTSTRTRSRPQPRRVWARRSSGSSTAASSAARRAPRLYLSGGEAEHGRRAVRRARRSRRRSSRTPPRSSARTPRGRKDPARCCSRSATSRRPKASGSRSPRSGRARSRSSRRGSPRPSAPPREGLALGRRDGRDRRRVRRRRFAARLPRGGQPRSITGSDPASRCLAPRSGAWLRFSASAGTRGRPSTWPGPASAR